MAMPGMGGPPLGAGAEPLDAPPPTTMMGGVGGSAPFSLQGLAPELPGQIPTGALPPEVLTGITQAAQQIHTMLASFAQITPDKGSQIAMMQDLLQQYLAGLMQAGAGPVSPTATGPAFPGGGIGRGIADAGSV